MSILLNFYDIFTTSFLEFFKNFKTPQIYTHSTALEMLEPHIISSRTQLSHDYLRKNNFWHTQKKNETERCIFYFE